MKKTFSILIIALLLIPTNVKAQKRDNSGALAAGIMAIGTGIAVMEQIKEQLVLQSKEVLNHWERIDKKIEDIKTDRDTISNKISSKYVDRYELLRKSEKVVVGYVNENQCGICGFLLSSNEIAKINSGDSDQCSSCGGILL